MNKHNVSVVLLSTIFFLLLNNLNISLQAYENTVPTTDQSLPEILYKVDREEAKEQMIPKVITVNYEGEIKTHITKSYSPVTALIDLGYSISNMNLITSTSPVSNLLNGSHIKVETYQTTIDEVLIEIPYGRVIEGSILCQSLSKEVKEQEGVLGLMTQRIKRVYKGGELIAEEVIEETVIRESRPEIIIIKGPEDLPSSVPQRGYNCTYWHAYVDNINASDEEKQWLKFAMKWESGCNAENNKSFYKGLLQWNPCLWYKQYPGENIFDGEAQIEKTLEKLRAGANPNVMWPAVHRKYKSVYGELSWLK